MLILGEHTDDKGTQLEQLTRRLIEEMGYTHIVTNRTGAAGEIDVSGLRLVDAPGTPQKYHLVCECKAKKDPIGMPDWLKFLGKIYVKEVECGNTVIGCFIALSGANGNVHESYDALLRDRKNLTLVSEDVLMQHLEKHHGLASISVVRSALKGLTAKPYSRIDVAYYAGKAYWVILFDKGEYTLVSAGGGYVARVDVASILKLIEEETTATTYIDLGEELTAQRTMALTQRMVLGLLMQGNGKVALKTVKEMAKGRIADEIVIQGIASLIEFNWAEKLSETEIGLGTARVNEIVNRAELFRLFLSGPFHTDVLGCEWWDKHIDEALLDEALRVQEGLTLSESDRNTALSYMRWSPMALLYALTPDQFIVYHRKTTPLLNGQLEATDQAQFIRSLHQHFVGDYGMRELARYFGQVRKMTEMLTLTQLSVKTDAGAEVLLSKIAEKQIIGQLGDEYGGQFVHLRGFATPEPNTLTMDGALIVPPKKIGD
jgi:hypothetical protein